MLLEYELQFQGWIDRLFDQRLGLLLDYQAFKRSQDYRHQVVYLLQMITSDEEFQSIVLIADNYCECTDNYFCFYCMLFEVTQYMTSSAYLESELLDVEEFSRLI